MEEDDSDDELQEQEQEGQIGRIVENRLVSADRRIVSELLGGGRKNTHTKTICGEIRGVSRRARGERAPYHEGGRHVERDDAGDLDGVRIAASRSHDACEQQRPGRGLIRLAQQTSSRRQDYLARDIFSGRVNWLGARDAQISIGPYLGIIMILHVPLKPMSPPACWELWVFPRTNSRLGPPHTRTTSSQWRKI